MSGDIAGAKEHIYRMKEIFGYDNFFLELQNHGIDEQLNVNDVLIDLAKQTKKRYSASNRATLHSFLHKKQNCIKIH